MARQVADLGRRLNNSKNYASKLVQDRLVFNNDIRTALGFDHDVNVESLFRDAADLNRRIEKEADQELAWSIVNGVPVEIEEEADPDE